MLQMPDGRRTPGRPTLATPDEILFTHDAVAGVVFRYRKGVVG
jgi:hypothetical protein